jgi:hypothetical protein
MACLIGRILGMSMYLCLTTNCYWHCGHSWPIVPASGDSEDDCGEADGM